MPAGDPQRTWFPQMIRRLRSEWHAEMPMAMLVDLRDTLDEMLHQIRRLGNIQTPIITCRKCGRTGHAAEPQVSVRAMILALARFEIAPRSKSRLWKRRGQNTVRNTSWIMKESPEASLSTTERLIEAG